MTQRRQRLTALVLGIAAILAMAVTAFHFARGGRSHPFILEKAELSSVQTGEQLLLSINDATAQELEALPGIGPALAERIISRREEYGPFEGKEDILAVTGIGETIYEAIQPYITY